MKALTIDGIGKSFGSTPVLDEVTLEVAAGEVVALLGPSGSGKTTLLRIVAGFEAAERGTIRWGEEQVDRLPPERRGFGMVFQQYALFPHRTVFGNVAFGLECQRLGREEIRERVARVLAEVDLVGFEHRKIGELSGGQQQRVALARALAPEPRLLLLDEPLSNLDPTLRARTRIELAQRLRAIGITTLLVTHEQEEAFELGDRVALLHRGRLEQVGAPNQLYRAPATRFVAGFVGHGSFVPATVRSRSEDGLRVRVVTPAVPGVEIDATAVAQPSAPGSHGELLLRPEALELAAPGSDQSVSGVVVAARFAGVYTAVVVRSESGGELEALVFGVAPALASVVAVRLSPGAEPRFYADAASG